MKAVNIAVSAVAIGASVLCLHLFAKYREVVEWNGKIYLLQTTTGRVWQVGQRAYKSGLHTAIDGLKPWGSAPMFVPTVDDVDDMGIVTMMEDDRTCKRLVPEQVACTRSEEGSSDDESRLLDYVSTREALPRSTKFEPLLEAVLSRVLPAHDANEEAPMVFAVRAAQVRSPRTLEEEWRVEELGPAVAFQGRAAAYFARVTGIASPRPEEFFDR